MKRVAVITLLLLSAMPAPASKGVIQENTAAAIARIRSASHSSLPEMSSIVAHGGGGGIDIENNSAGTLAVHFSGLTTKSVIVQPGDSAEVSLGAGSYEVAAEVIRSSAKPFYGQLRFDQNVFYRIKFSVPPDSISTTSSEPTNRSGVTVSGNTDLSSNQSKSIGLSGLANAESPFNDTVWNGYDSEGFKVSLSLYFGGRAKFTQERKSEVSLGEEFIPNPGGGGTFKSKGNTATILTCPLEGLWRQEGNHIVIECDPNRFSRGGCKYSIGTTRQETGVNHVFSLGAYFELMAITDGNQMKGTNWLVRDNEDNAPINTLTNPPITNNPKRKIRLSKLYKSSSDEWTAMKVGKVEGSLSGTKDWDLSLIGILPASNIEGTNWRGKDTDHTGVVSWMTSFEFRSGGVLIHKKEYSWERVMTLRDKESLKA
jgi:hypothetical protein